MVVDSTVAERHWTVSVYVVAAGRTLLHFHRRTGLWLPPGGHLDPGETPDDAARREVFEETGLRVELEDVAGAGWYSGKDGGRALARPIGVQLVTFAPGHEHLDLIYLARQAVQTPELPAVHGDFLWLTNEEAATKGAPSDVVGWSRQAIATASLRS